MSRDFLRSPLVGLLACLLALVVAMGVGRFSLTPQLPHLIREGQLDLTGAGLLAAANYLGYLVGALDALFAREARQARLRLLVGLWACFGLTLASVWAEGFWPHALLRFGLGVASAWVLIMVTALSQRLAAESGRARLGALVFAGPGIGVMVTGLLAALGNALGQDSVFIWKLFADLALVLILMLLPLLPRPAARSAGHDAPATASENAGLGRLTWAYGLVGLGYIIPATFLSQMAAARFHGQWQADLFWPCFGLASATGVVLISLRRQRPDGTRRWLVGALWLQALGVLACLLPGIGGLALGVVLTGLPFLAGMQLVMQYARELAPHTPQRNAGQLTTGFALDQLLGPLLAALSTHFAGGLQPALALAGLGLVFAGLLLRRPHSLSVAAGVAATARR
ncbi:TPA: MFS transporter [Pseudomonas aeruginosa]|nr:MFS transporter [Pseudomonas aeruginosa]